MTISDAAELLLAEDEFLILTHRRPDGDTIGSAAALCRTLKACGKTAYLFPNEEFTPKYAFLYKELVAPEGFRPRKIVAVDIAATQLLPDSAAAYENEIYLSLDHHGSNTSFARNVLTQPRRSATGELIWDLALALSVAPDRKIAEAVYVAIATDTGCFCYPNTTPRCHEIAARAIELGVPFGVLNKLFFETKTKGRFFIERYLFGNLRFSESKRIAGVVISQRQIAECGATPDDMDNLSSLPRQIEGIECSITLTELEAGGYKGSVRTGPLIDASALCGHFGGGGHPRAAGFTTDGGAEEALALLMQLAEQELAHA